MIKTTEKQTDYEETNLGNIERVNDDGGDDGGASGGKCTLGQTQLNIR